MENRATFRFAEHGRRPQGLEIGNNYVVFFLKLAGALRARARAGG
jgi:hypothetical protein